MSSSTGDGPIVLDASEVWALLFNEAGGEVVRTQLQAAVIGALNPAEVLAKLSDRGLPEIEAVRAVAVLGWKSYP